jgi:hypothetical protein
MKKIICPNSVWQKKFSVQILVSKIIVSGHLVDKVIYSSHNVGINMFFVFNVLKNNFFLGQAN